MHCLILYFIDLLPNIRLTHYDALQDTSPGQAVGRCDHVGVGHKAASAQSLVRVIIYLLICNVGIVDIRLSLSVI